jgi:hypothetical protein
MRSQPNKSTGPLRGLPYQSFGDRLNRLRHQASPCQEAELQHSPLGARPAISRQSQRNNFLQPLR